MYISLDLLLKGESNMKKLHVYSGATHEHQAQKPVAFDLKTLNK